MCGNIRPDRVFVLLTVGWCRAYGQAPDIVDIAPPVDMPRAVPWILILAGAAIIAAAAAWYFLRRAPAVGVDVAYVEAHELALQQIEALGRPGDVAGRFGELEGILRSYLERRFDLGAPHATVRELAERLLERRTLNPAQYRTLADLLDRCEVVRFGGVRPSEEATAAMIETARTWIENTRLRLAEPSTGSMLLGGRLPGRASDAAH